MSFCEWRGFFRVADDFRFQGNRRTIRGDQRNKDDSLKYISLVENGQGEGISGKELSYRKSYKYFVVAYRMAGNKKVSIAKTYINET